MGNGDVCTAFGSDFGFGDDGGARAHVMIYALAKGPAAYPMITSAGTEALLGWGALSGLAADAEIAGKLYAVSDSVYAMAPTIYTIDATQTPARITGSLLVTRAGDAAQKIEGFAIDSAGTGWVVTDNDGVADSAGETLFWSIGAVQKACACE